MVVLAFNTRYVGRIELYVDGNDGLLAKQLNVSPFLSHITFKRFLPDVKVLWNFFNSHVSMASDVSSDKHIIIMASYCKSFNSGTIWNLHLDFSIIIILNLILSSLHFNSYLESNKIKKNKFYIFRVGMYMPVFNSSIIF